MSVIDAAVDLSGPAPRVRVTTDSPGRIYQVAADGSRAPVRGSYDDTTEAWDWEVQQGSEVGYAVEGQDSPVTVVVPALEDLWLVPCQQPDAATLLLVERDGFAEWEHAGEESVLPIPGGRPHVVAWRSRARATSLTTVALDSDAADAAVAALTAPGHHFVSVPPRMWPWRGVTYVAVSGVQMKPLRDRSELWLVSFTVTEVDRPTVPLSRPSGWLAMPDRWAQMPDTWAEMPA